MASPQVDDGYTRIAHEILEALGRTNLCAYESRVLHILWRKTWGFNKKADRISISQWQEYTGLTASNVCHAIGKLKQRNVILATSDKNGGKGHITEYQFQKNHELWDKPLSEQTVLEQTVLEQTTNTVDLDNQTLPKATDTINIPTKETITKEKVWGNGRYGKRKKTGRQDIQGSRENAADNWGIGKPLN